jgi:type IV pilus assembly protein PilV
MHNRSTGFTLVEVLVAMLILATGLLGLAGLQASSLGNNQSAFNRGQATQLAYDLADRIRANKAGIVTYQTVNPAGAAGVPACLTVAGCSPANMAQNDLYEWNNAIVATLPNGSGSIAVELSMFTISITWDDDRDGDDTNNHVFETSFQL